MMTMTFVLGRTQARFPRLGHWLRAMVHTFAARRQIALQRRALLAMDDRMLNDIGLSRVDALRAAQRMSCAHRRRWP